ncbi:MAG: nucleotidyltransferase [Firmicutes bacterium]|nr:nucleotidyltransferase [Bacillota bacterium]
MPERLLGVIAEYNPLHNGHHYHLKKAKAETNADLVLVAMSGNFVQRGEPALLNKWMRTKLALQAGADLVIELPCYFALQSAETFARAGIGLLNVCGINCLSFGSESGDLATLSRLAEIIDNPETQNTIKTTLSSGITYARAVQTAVERNNLSSASASRLMSGANNILGIEYIRAARALGANLDFHTVLRTGPGHHSTEPHAYGSATAIRQAVQQGRMKDACKMLPSGVQATFFTALDEQGPVFISNFAQIIFHKLRTSDAEQLRRLQSISEGLENRFKNHAWTTNDLYEFLRLVKTKRYPRTRLQRILMQLMLDFENIPQPKTYTPYIRVLGYTAQGRSLAKRLAGGKIPVIFSPAKDANRLDITARALLNLDLRAGDYYSLATRKPLPMELTLQPIEG